MGKKVGLSLILVLALAIVGLAAANYSSSCPQHNDCASQNACCAKHGGRGLCLIDCRSLPGPKGVLKYESELGLTEEQVSKLKALCLATQKEKVRIEADTKILKLEVAELLDKKVVDKAAVDAKIDEIAQLRAKCAKQCVQTKLDTRGILTEDQLKKMKTLKASCPQDAPSMPCQKSQADSSSSGAMHSCMKNK
jgi:Spy/CpxP family protein refolding chaperone